MNMKAALILSSALIAASAHADFIGATLEAGAFNPDSELTLQDDGSSPITNKSNMDGERGTYYGIAIEHPIPVIPNLRIQGTELVSKGTITTTYNGSSVNDAAAELDLSHTDYTLYYEFLDGIFWLHFDAGFTLRDYDGSVNIDSDITSLNAVVPMLYIAPSIAIPGTGLSFGAEIKNLSIGNNSITDTTLKVKWDSGFLFGIEAGTRSHDVVLDDIDGLDINSINDGAFVGIFLDF